MDNIEKCFKAVKVVVIGRPQDANGGNNLYRNENDDISFKSLLMSTLVTVVSNYIKLQTQVYFIISCN